MGAGFPSTKAAQYAALKAVIDPDTFADYRKICRWFSRTFVTPLVEVYDLPSDFVLQHYLEDQYEALTHEERRDKLIELTETPEERIERMRRQELEDHESNLQSKATLDTVMAKISNMKGSDIKAGLDAYRADLAEKKAVKEGQRAEKKGPSRADIIAALSGAKPREANGPAIIPDLPPEGSKPLPPKAAAPPDYPDFSMNFDDIKLDGIDFEADSVSLPKKP